MAPLKGELSAQLTEGSGLAESQALRRRRKYQVLEYLGLNSACGGGFSSEKPDPSDPAFAGPALLCIKSP